MRKVQDAAYQSAKQELSWETGTNEIEINIVNSSIVNMMIDGYKVTNPLGFKGSDFKIQVYNAFAPLVHVGALEKIALELDLELITISAEPYAVARSILGNNEDNDMNAVLVDIGGGTTDIALVNEGGVDGTEMYGIGGRSFTKSIADRLSLDKIKAEELKLNLSQSETSISPKQIEGLKESIKSTTELWLQGLAISLEELAEGDQLPYKFMFCGGGSSLRSLISALKTNEWREDLAISRTPMVNLIKPSDVQGIADKTGKINDHKYITTLGLLRVGHDTLYIDGTSKLQSKVNKLLKT